MLQRTANQQPDSFRQVRGQREQEGEVRGTEPYGLLLRGPNLWRATRALPFAASLHLGLRHVVADCCAAHRNATEQHRGGAGFPLVKRLNGLGVNVDACPEDFDDVGFHTKLLVLLHWKEYSIQIQLCQEAVSMLMLDLCSGLGGASDAFRARGWEVVTVDNNNRFAPTICADLREWTYTGPAPDFIWLSDPCTEFARESMPWSRTGRQPDMSILLAGLRIIREARPRHWARENVRGSVRWVRDVLGAPREIHGPFFLWGTFPPLGKPVRRFRPKESYSSTQAAERAKVPYALSEAMAVAIEAQGSLFVDLATRPAREGRENREAEAAKQMLAKGAWADTPMEDCLRALVRRGER